MPATSTTDEGKKRPLDERLLRALATVENDTLKPWVLQDALAHLDRWRCRALIVEEAADLFRIERDAARAERDAERAKVAALEGRWDLKRVMEYVAAERDAAFAAGRAEGWRAAIEAAAIAARDSCLVPPDGGAPTEEEQAHAHHAALCILALPSPAVGGKEGEGWCEHEWVDEPYHQRCAKEGCDFVRSKRAALLAAAEGMEKK